MQYDLGFWLTRDVNDSDDGYRHMLLVEDISLRAKAIKELKLIVERAHSDALQRLEDLFAPTLNPFGVAEDTSNPVAGYPSECGHSTRMGYFGEIVAGVVAEQFAPFDKSCWEVPAYLFRFHKAAFQHLERNRQTDDIEDNPIPGRTGDDCLAFCRDDDGYVTGILVCEAKCLASHNSRKLEGAHEKLNDTPELPVDLPQLIEILSDYPDEESQKWASALRLLRLGHSPVTPKSYHLISYICGNGPKRDNREAWAGRDAPDDVYENEVPLEVSELHAQDIVSLVNEVYKVGRAE